MSSAEKAPLLRSADDAQKKVTSAKKPSGLAAAANEVMMATSSKNVPRVIAYNFIDGACFSIWQAQVFQVLLYNIGGNSAVGWISGASGVAQIFAALVAGYAADKIARERTCQVAAFSGIVAIGLSLYGTYLLYIPLFYISAVIWGVYMGLANPASEALFADSVPSGRRAKIYSFKWIVQILCYVVGYVASLVMFLTMGNHWKNSTMQVVMYAGLSLHPLSMVMLLTIRDRHSLKGKSASAIPTSPKDDHDDNDGPKLTHTEKGQEKKVEEPAEKSALEILENPEEGGGEEGVEEGRGPISAKSNAEGESAASTPVMHHHALTGEPKRPKPAPESRGLISTITKALSHHSYTPYFICTGDFLLACGSGMTLRYIPLFFVNDYSVGPVELMLVFISISFVTSLMAQLALKLSSRIGRIRSMLLIRGSGTSLLMYLAVAEGPAANVWPMLAVFVIRNALMNSTLGMSRSMIMDCVRKENRSKWSAVESFSSFTWSGSALIGGYLADAHGYRFSFLITAILHYVATAVLIPAYFSSRKLELLTMRLNEKKEAKEKQKPVKGSSSCAVVVLQKEDEEVGGDEEASRKNGTSERRGVTKSRTGTINS